MWTEEVLHLAEFATSQPHAAYTAFVHGLSTKWTYLSRTVPEIKDLFQPLENAIHQVLIPSITGCPPVQKLIRDLLALPVRLGGLGIVNPTETADDKFHASVKLTAPLVTIIASQDQNMEIDPTDVITAKREIRVSNSQQTHRGDLFPTYTTTETKCRSCQRMWSIIMALCLTTLRPRLPSKQG